MTAFQRWVQTFLDDEYLNCWPMKSYWRNGRFALSTQLRWSRSWPRESGA